MVFSTFIVKPRHVSRYIMLDNCCWAPWTLPYEKVVYADYQLHPQLLSESYMCITGLRVLVKTHGTEAGQWGGN